MKQDSNISISTRPVTMTVDNYIVHFKILPSGMLQGVVQATSATNKDVRYHVVTLHHDAPAILLYKILKAIDENKQKINRGDSNV